jgi:hypothetical protein
MLRVAVVCFVAALGLAPASSEAAAKVKSHSNTNNNRFSDQCTSLGGKAVDGAGGTTTCTLPPAGPASPNLTAACAQDGGKLVQQGGAWVCKSGKP